MLTYIAACLRVCLHAADNSSLLLLNVRGNKLEGDAKGVETCGNLVQLDIQGGQQHVQWEVPVEAYSGTHP